MNNSTLWSILFVQVSRRTGAEVAGVVWMSCERSGRAAGHCISPGTGATTGTTGAPETTATPSTAAGIITGVGVGVGRNALDLTLDLSLEGFGEIVLPPPFAVHEGLFPAGRSRSSSPSTSLALALTSTFATSPTETDTLGASLLEQLASRQHDLHTPEPVGTPPAFPLPSAGALPFFHHSILLRNPVTVIRLQITQPCYRRFTCACLIVWSDKQILYIPYIY